MEEQLVTSISILLPSGQLVVDSQRHALLEPFTSPCGEADYVTVRLQLERHLEVFRDVMLGPELLVAIFVEVADLLDR